MVVLKQYVFDACAGTKTVEVYVAVDAVNLAVFGKLPNVVVLVALNGGLLAAVACQKQDVVVEIG